MLNGLTAHPLGFLQSLTHQLSNMFAQCQERLQADALLDETHSNAVKELGDIHGLGQQLTLWYRAVFLWGLGRRATCHSTDEWFQVAPATLGNASSNGLWWRIIGAREGETLLRSRVVLIRSLWLLYHQFGWGGVFLWNFRKLGNFGNLQSTVGTSSVENPNPLFHVLHYETITYGVPAS